MEKRKLTDLQLHALINLNGGEPATYDYFDNPVHLGTKGNWEFCTGKDWYQNLWGYDYDDLAQMGAYRKPRMTWAEYRAARKSYREYYHHCKVDHELSMTQGRRK